jgi:hypothetical protein
MGLLRAPLGHWIIAVIFAVAAGWGVRAWLNHRATQSTETATLSWDASVARHVDPTLADAAEPAVALAQSILSDAVVDGLARSASLPVSRAARIGEFRSRLELRQSSASLLQVGFHDANPEQAEKTTNAVAGALIAGTSAPASASAPVAPPHAEKPPAAPVKAPVADPPSAAKTALASALGQMGTELSATQKKLDGLNSGTWDRREHAGESSSYRESKQQQLLTAQVGAALKEVADLRADPANSGKAAESLRRIHEALASVWPASRSDRSARSSAVFMGFNAAGVNAGRLREERAQFTHALDVVQKEQAAAQRLEPVEAPKPPAPTQSATESAAAEPASLAPSEAAPPIAESEIPKSPEENPFGLLRPAGTPVHSPLWPPVLAGFCCGLLYLGAAASRYRDNEEDEEAEYADEGAVASQRLITPAKPMRPAEFFATADARPAESSATVETRPAEIVLPSPQIERAEPPEKLHEEKSPSVIDHEISMAADDQKTPFREGMATDHREGDPWIDNIMKSLSETSIGRMFETPTDADQEAGPEAEAERRRLSNRPGRLAG